MIPHRTEKQRVKSCQNCLGPDVVPSCCDVVETVRVGFAPPWTFPSPSVDSWPFDQRRRWSAEEDQRGTYSSQSVVSSCLNRGEGGVPQVLHFFYY